MKALLALEDGKFFGGESFATPGEVSGEVVFNTSMTGYQEILTDPSYQGQIVTMTYPHIGNYGATLEDDESRRPFAQGLIVREASEFFSNWRAQKSLRDFLFGYGLIGIEGIDTRALTKHLRSFGAMRGIISTEDLNPKSLIAKAKSSPGLLGRDLVKEVTCDSIYELNPLTASENEKFLVVVMDFGAKKNILQSLLNRHCKVIVVPAETSLEQILSFQPQGIVLSNGPGDPAAVSYAIDTVRKLIEGLKKGEIKLPVFGICLGHQLIGLASGGKTYKLKFGHRGANHPVKNLITGRVEITTQNHGFCVDVDTLNKEEIEVTHLNLNDRTNEGIRYKDIPVFCVQYHPEASPGPHDSAYLFDQFVGEMEKVKVETQTLNPKP